MAQIQVVENGSVHIIVGPGRVCECGIAADDSARCCQDILQDMVNRHHAEYANGKVPATPTLEMEDSVPSPQDLQNPLQAS